MKNLKFKIVSILIGITLAFTIAELAYRVKLRFFGDYETSHQIKKFLKYSDNEKLLVDLIPNSEVTINKVNYSVNSYGYRDDEWSLNDTTTVKIGLISDSVGFPFGLPHEEGYEYQSEQLLAKDSINAQVLNFALNGYNANQYIEILKEIKHKGIKLDYLIANITSNDYQPTGKPSMLPWIDHPNSKYSWIPSKLIKRAIEYNYKKNVHPNLYSYSYIENYLDELISFSKEENTKVVVLLSPSKTKETNDGFYTKTKLNSEKRGFDVIFPLKQFNATENKDELFYPNDLMHLSKKGHTFIAENITEYFKNKIH